MYITYKFRIKDSSHTTWLCEKAKLVNWAWNAAQDFRLNYVEQNKDNEDKKSRYPTEKILYNSVKIEGLYSQTKKQAIKEYLKKLKQFKKFKLKWRASKGSKRSLGWIPCTNQAVAFNKDDGTFQYMKRKFKCWYSRPLEGKIMSVSFNEDARGRWYINVVCESKTIENAEAKTREIGIDLGCKDQIVCSDGVKYSRASITKSYQEKLAMAQRANKKTLIKTIHAKMANIRKDWAHKITTAICQTSKLVVVGDIQSKKLMRTKMAKSLADAGHYQIKSLLEYKAIRHNTTVVTNSEARSTLTCSACSKRTGPSGLRGLGVRYWECSDCGASHDRDVNAAVNILISFQDIGIQSKGIPAL